MMSDGTYIGLTRAASGTTFDEWAKRELKRIADEGISYYTVNMFLKNVLEGIQHSNETLLQLTYKLNDAFLGAGIALKDAPWFNQSGRFSRPKAKSAINYLEVEIVGFPEPFAATI